MQPSLGADKPSQQTDRASTAQIQEVAERLRDTADANAAQLLSELRKRNASVPTNVAVAAIGKTLNAKLDASTGLGFKVASNGMLDEAPTLRTFLLDELARIDPAAAAEYAKNVLASKDSPDEWAVALRNLAKGDTSATAKALLEEKTLEMLQHEPWLREPSVGFLEAFDVAVYLGKTNLVPILSRLVRRQDDPAVAHASFLALDRMVINDASSILPALMATPDLMQGRETTRANYFARADVRDPQQRNIVETYLANRNVTAAELNAFAGVYPNANFMISPNLLTSNRTIDHASLVARDVESLRVVDQWLADPRFANRRDTFEKISARLREFVRQANQNQ